MRLFPKPELIAVRITSFIFGIILLSAIYSIGVRFGGRKLGILSAFILAVSPPFCYSVHLGRYDIFVSAFGFAVIAVHLHQRPPKRFGPSLLAGLLSLLAFEIHPNGAIYIPVVFILFMAEMGCNALHSSGFWGFITGIGIGGLFYLELHVLRFPETYAAITKLAFSSTHMPPILTAPAQERISQSVHTNDIVMGPQIHWFGLYGHKYYSWETIIYYNRLVPGNTFADAIGSFVLISSL